MLNPAEVDHVGPYRVTRLLDADAGLLSFEVEDPQLPGRRLRLTLLPDSASATAVRRFDAQLQLLIEAETRSLPGLLLCDRAAGDDAGCEPGRYYTTTWLAGRPISRAVGERPGEVIALVAELLDAIAILHDRGVVHCELDLASAVLQPDGRVVLTKLGAALHTDDASAGDFVRSRFSAPECLAEESASPASDVFSVGALIYEMLTQRSVYAVRATADVTAADLAGQSLAFHVGELRGRGADLDLEFPAAVPRSVRKVIVRACRVDAGARYADARGFALALRRASLVASRPAWLLSGHNRRPIQIAVAAGLLLLAFGAGTSMQLSTSGSDRAEMLTAQLAELLEVDARAVGLVRELQTLRPALPGDAIADAEHELRVAQSARTSAERALGGSRYTRAVKLFELAAAAYDKVCGKTVISGLESRRDESQRSLAKRVAGLDRAGAAAARPGAWQVLQSRSTLAHAATPGSGADSCGRAAETLAEVRELDETQQVADAIERDLTNEPRAPHATPAAALIATESARPARSTARTLRAVSPRSKPAEQLAQTRDTSGRAQSASPPSDVPEVSSEPPAHRDRDPRAVSAPPPSVEKSERVAQEAAYAALALYERAYESMDLRQLERVWKMNPSQRRAMREFFLQMDDIALEIERHAIRVTDGRAAIDFGLRIEARGPGRAASTNGSVPMRAHVQQNADEHWWISRIEARP